MIYRDKKDELLTYFLFKGKPVLLFKYYEFALKLLQIQSSLRRCAGERRHKTSSNFEKNISICIIRAWPDEVGEGPILITSVLMSVRFSVRRL